MTGEWAGAEVLINWPNAPYIARTPEMFIPMAEKFGHMEDITWQIMRKTALFLKDMDYPEGFFISFNASRDIISNPLFARECRYFLNYFKENKEKLTLCVETTGQHDDNNEIPYPALMDLSRMGVKLTIDNFGSGYNNIESLQMTNLIDKIKIDKTFIEQIHPFKNNILLNAIVSLANSMKLNIIANGVKKEFQREKLIHKKILLHQGSLYSTPIHASEFPIKLQANNPKNQPDDSVPSTISYN